LLATNHSENQIQAMTFSESLYLVIVLSSC